MLIKKKQSHNGFTLVEIIVSIAIFSVVLAILGSILVTGFKYFYETTSTDMDKRSIDEIAKYVRGELLYATDVQITDQLPGTDFYSFSVVDGKLHQYDVEGTDLNIFNNNAFYNNHSFKMSAKAYENNNRLDLSFIMYDGDENLYTTKDTLELLNIKAIEKAPFAEDKLISKDYRIYYKKSMMSIPEEPNEPESQTTGTVADRKINLINYGNSRGYFTKGFHYNKGDYVYYDDAWWYKNGDQTNDDREPNSITGGWTKLTEEYPLGEYSWYYPGDVVKYQGKYIKCQNKWNPTTKSTNSSTLPRIDTNMSGEWAEYDWVEITEDEAKSTQYTNAYENKEKTVAYKLPESIVVTDVERAIIQNYIETKDYKVGDFVRKEVPSTGYYNVYLKVFDGTGELGLSNQSGWQLLQADYNSKSSYIVGDLVISHFGNLANTSSGSRFKYFECIQNVLTKDSFNEYVSTSGDKYTSIESVSKYLEITKEEGIGDITKYFYKEIIR